MRSDYPNSSAGAARGTGRPPTPRAESLQIIRVQIMDLTRNSGLDPMIQPDWTVVSGEFDLATADPVREALTRALGDARRRLIVDLSGVTLIDSSGMHVTLDAYRRAPRHWRVSGIAFGVT